MRDTDLIGFSKWYKALGVDLGKLTYYQLTSSSGEEVTILPMTKIEKDRTKNEAIINEMLEEIGLPSHNYTTKFQQGVQVLCLGSENATCRFSLDEDTLETFEPDVASGETLVLVI